MNPEMMSQEPMHMAEVKERLEESKKGSELNFRAQKTFDYLMHNTLIKDSKGADELKKKIDELNVLRLKDIHVIKLIDTMPVSVEEAKSVLSTYPISVTNENLKKIVDVIDGYRKE